MDGSSHHSELDREILRTWPAIPSREHSNHRQPPPAAAAVAVERPLACTYLRADGWRDDATCGVCLEDLADGDAVTLLQPCRHCFHAACGSRWIRLRATCPLCRAAVANDDGTVLSPAGSSDDVHA